MCNLALIILRVRLWELAANTRLILIFFVNIMVSVLGMCWTDISDPLTFFILFIFILKFFFISFAHCFVLCDYINSLQKQYWISFVCVCLCFMEIILLSDFFFFILRVSASIFWCCKTDKTFLSKCRITYWDRWKESQGKNSFLVGKEKLDKDIYMWYL